MFEEYLARVKLPGAPPISEQGLRDLHAGQSFALPFENITPLLHEPVALDVSAWFEKMVRGRRGGYCFEVNGLFRWALLEAGFSPRVHLARVQAHNPEPGPFTHQISLVHAGGRDWLCDVGFGGPGIRYPMPFELGRVDEQDGDDYRLSLDPELGYRLEGRVGGEDWMPLYFFPLQKARALDIVMGNHFTSTWENSLFRRAFLLARPFPGGKSTLFGRNFKRRSAEGVREEKITDPARLRTLLPEEFGIELDTARLEKLERVLAGMG